jgi:outer membrane lipopolysaccharide assembly protein LptE/RlpB
MAMNASCLTHHALRTRREAGRKLSNRKFSPFDFSYILNFLFFLLLFSGCGYHFAGSGPLPQGIQRVSVAEVDNLTLETGSEKELQWALEREFRGRGGVTVTDEGEGVLNVTMRQLDFHPLSFDSRDQVLEYEVTLLLDVILMHRETGQTLWQANNLRVVSDYSAVPQVVVTTSPEFQQGTLNPEDLSGLTDIQFSETQKRTAIEQLFTAAAREVYFRLSENF